MSSSSASRGAAARLDRTAAGCSSPRLPLSRSQGSPPRSSAARARRPSSLPPRARARAQPSFCLNPPRCWLTSPTRRSSWNGAEARPTSRSSPTRRPSPAPCRHRSKSGGSRSPVRSSSRWRASARVRWWPRSRPRASACRTPRRSPRATASRSSPSTSRRPSIRRPTATSSRSRSGPGIRGAWPWANGRRRSSPNPSSHPSPSLLAGTRSPASLPTCCPTPCRKDRRPVRT